MSKRTFMAIHIRPEPRLLEFMHAVQRKFSNSRINWVSPDTLHLTLRFLGNTTADQMKRIRKEAPGLFSPTTPLEIGLKGFGKFGSTEKPKVLWIGVEESGLLSDLAVRTEQMVRNAGFDGEERTFRPHLTIGRVKWLKEPDKLKEMLDAYREVYFQRPVIKEVIFYESILRPEGPLYRPIQVFQLEG